MQQQQRRNSNGNDGGSGRGSIYCVGLCYCVLFHRVHCSARESERVQIAGTHRKERLCVSTEKTTNPGNFSTLRETLKNQNRCFFQPKRRETIRQNTKNNVHF